MNFTEFYCNYLYWYLYFVCSPDQAHTPLLTCIPPGDSVLFLVLPHAQLAFAQPCKIASVICCFVILMLYKVKAESIFFANSSFANHVKKIDKI